MNRTKIEEIAEKLFFEHNCLVSMDNFGNKSVERVLTKENFIKALTSLLAEGGGEVKEQAPSELRINDEYVLSDKGVEKAPSATVDLPAIKTLFAKWCNAKTEDTHSNAMTLNAFAVAVTELLHSQQPTVDVDALAKKIIQSISELVYVNIGDNAPLRKDVEKKVSDILSRTLSQKRYTEQQMIDFAQMCQMESDGTKWEGNTIGRLLTKFDSEGNNVDLLSGK